MRYLILDGREGLPMRVHNGRLHCVAHSLPATTFPSFNAAEHAVRLHQANSGHEFIADYIPLETDESRRDHTRLERHSS